MLGNLIDKSLKKSWSTEDIKKYVGDFRHVALTYAIDSVTRERAASGGSVSALLIHGLESQEFEGAVVCYTKVEGGKVRARLAIATTRDEVLAARGSKYVQGKFLGEALDLIKAFDGRVAIVGLPCDLTGLKRRCEKSIELKQKVVLTIALVCGHNSRTELIDHVTEKIEKEHGSKIVDYRFRVGHWRGRLEADLANGQTISKPTKTFNDYQNLFFFSERKCMACIDHYGYDADISAGDVWLFRLKDDPIKHTGIIARTENGEKVLKSAVEKNALGETPLKITDIMDGQSRIGPSHYNITARYKVSKFFGIKLKDTVRENVSWHELLNAFITLANMKLSESTIGRKIIFKCPRLILKSYLYFKKALESIK